MLLADSEATANRQEALELSDIFCAKRVARFEVVHRARAVAPVAPAVRTVCRYLLLGSQTLFRHTLVNTDSVLAYPTASAVLAGVRGERCEGRGVTFFEVLGASAVELFG